MIKLTKTQRKLAKRLAVKGKCTLHTTAIKEASINRGFAKIMGLILFHMVTPEKYNARKTES